MGKFVKDSLITFIVRFSSLFLGLGVSIILARGLGPEGRGVLALAVLLPNLLITFTNFGINYASAFYAGKKKYSPAEILGNNLILSFIVSIFTILIGIIIILFFGDDLFRGVSRMNLFLALPLIPCQVFLLFTVNILWGLQKIKEYNFIDFFNSLLGLILLAVFIFGFGLGVKTAIVAQVVSSLFAITILFFLMRRVVGPFSLRLNKLYLKDTFLYGMKMYFGGILSLLHSRLDIFIINAFLNPFAVGLYFTSKILAEKILLIPQSASFVLFPRVSSEKDDKALREFTPIVCRHSLFITTIGIIFLFFLGRWLITLLYSEEFLDSVLAFRILLIGSIAASGAGSLCSDLAARGKPMINNYIAIFLIVLNVTLNIILIPKFGIEGAAWATTVSLWAGFIISLIVYDKISGNKIKDVIFLQKSDAVFYKNFLNYFKSRIKPILQKYV